MKTLLAAANKNQQRACEIIEELNIIEAWESIGATINLVGSLKSGLLMKHRDIDFHIYSDPPEIAGSFAAIAKIAASPRIQRIECRNLLYTEEACIEWHTWYQDRDNDIWQIDMIHIVKGSAFDGFVEQTTDNVIAALTPETRLIILQLKNDTPDTEKIMGIEYYKAVLKDGVRTYDEFVEWRKANPVAGITEF